MKWLVIAALLAAGGYFAWKKVKSEEPPAQVTNPEKTPGADMKNRIDNLSGTAPE